jgi:hypothetical protein
MKYVDTFKHWSTYFFAFWIELVTTRAQLFFCFRRKDCGCVLGNLMLVAWWVLAVSVPRYLYSRCGRQKSQQ